MFSDGKDNFFEPEQKHHVENKGIDGVRDTHDCNKFPLPSNSVIGCQQASLFCLNEKRTKLLKLLEEHDNKIKHFKSEKKTDGEFPTDNEKKPFEETDESDTENLDLEVSESDYEATKEYSEEDWRAIDDNQCNLEDICGLEEIKESLFNVLIYPSLYPQFFPSKQLKIIIGLGFENIWKFMNNIILERIRWNQILLYGPPGAGKTMLAKALASEINATMHRITSADLLSHWQGQTEKQIKNLFQAVHSSPEPKILFLDEIDGLFRQRTKDESDCTRRIKTEFLISLDNFTAEFENHQTFLIGATNCPWEIDSSFMRRFHKKIFVPLPDKKARLDIIKKSFENIETDLTDSEWNEIGVRTEGYSGSELVNVVMTSCCERFMEVKNCKYWKAEGDFWIPVDSCSLLAVELNFEDIHPEKVSVRNIIFADLMEAIRKTPKTVDPEILLKYLEYSDKNKIE